MDAEANLTCVGIEASIAVRTSRAAIEVIRVDEASILAGEAAWLLGHTT